MSASSIRIVDLFCGCGGLSLGFDTFMSETGDRPFRVALGLDNWDAALRIYNTNHAGRSDGAFPVGRAGDLLWFDHASEALLFYLVHFAYSTPDEELRARLLDLGLLDFLGQLEDVDASATAQLTELGQDPDYLAALSSVDGRVFSLAACKAALGRLHLSLRDLRLDIGSLPWSYEYSRLADPGRRRRRSPVSVIAEYRRAAASLWERVEDQVGAGSSGIARGQHKVNPARMGSLKDFLKSRAGRALQQIWSSWFAQRLSVREKFCLASHDALRSLYTEGRRVHLLLGGPPCKGFSRIGRAVIRELRKQGAHAWASDTFGDERNALMYKYVLFLEALRPDAFIFENVSNFTSRLKTPEGELNAPELLEELIDDLDCSDLHYSVDARIVRAREHSIPQARERYIMCGVSSGAGTLAEAERVLRLRRASEEVPLLFALSGLATPREFSFDSHEGDKGGLVDAASLAHFGTSPASREFLSWIRSPQPDSAGPPTAVDSHIFRRPRQDDARLYKMLAPGIRWMDMKTESAPSLALIRNAMAVLLSAIPPGKRSASLVSAYDGAIGLLDDSLALRLLLEQMSRDLPEEHHLLQGGYLANGSGRHGDWLERLPAMKPCKTVVAHIGKDTYGYIHPFEPRPITVREAARIQSFPDWFRFGGVGIVDAYSMIGNAVPPLLANHLARQLWEIHQERGLFAGQYQGAKGANMARRPRKQIAIEF